MALNIVKVIGGKRVLCVEMQNARGETKTDWMDEATVSFIDPNLVTSTGLSTVHEQVIVEPMDEQQLESVETPSEIESTSASSICQNDEQLIALQVDPLVEQQDGPLAEISIETNADTETHAHIETHANTEKHADLSANTSADSPTEQVHNNGLKCPHCEVTIKRSDHLKEHIKNMHGRTEIYKCPIKDCPREIAFTTKYRSNWTQHMKRVHGWDTQQSKAVIEGCRLPADHQVDAQNPDDSEDTDDDVPLLVRFRKRKHGVQLKCQSKRIRPATAQYEDYENVEYLENEANNSGDEKMSSPDVNDTGRQQGGNNVRAMSHNAREGLVNETGNDAGHQEDGGTGNHSAEDDDEEFVPSPAFSPVHPMSMVTSDVMHGHSDVMHGHFDHGLPNTRPINIQFIHQQQPSLYINIPEFIAHYLSHGANYRSSTAFSTGATISEVPSVTMGTDATGNGSPMQRETGENVPQDKFEFTPSFARLEDNELKVSKSFNITITNENSVGAIDAYLTKMRK